MAIISISLSVCERWSEMKDAAIAIVWEARTGGQAVGLIGIESQPLSRIGEVPHDGPEAWTGATLFPLSSKKIGRAVVNVEGPIIFVVTARYRGGLRGLLQSPE